MTAQKTTSEIRELLKIANKNFEDTENKALNEVSS
jgi:hypothetical protein